MTPIPDTLTRHFYVLDEVIGGLRAACIAGRGQEAAFWLQELIDSEEIGWGVSTLVETCILYYGVHGIGWLKEAYNCFKEEDIGLDELHAACADLCGLEQQDHSLIALQLQRVRDLGKVGPPEYITSEVAASPPLHRYFITAIHQGKVRAAYWAAAGMTENELESCISSAIAEDKDRRDLWKIVCGLRRWACIDFGFDSLVAISLMVICAPAAVKVYNFKGRRPWLEARTEWESLKGRRARRSKQVHWSAFYLETRRGRMSYYMTTITELRSIGESSNTIPRLCTYWQQLLDEIQMSGSDDVWEEFCRHAFPDDIPDEWSAVDQEWSHGTGKVGQAECNANVAKWLWRFNLEASYYTYGISFKDIVASETVSPEQQWTAIAWLKSLKSREPTFRMLATEDQEINNLSAVFIRRMIISTT